ncbi:hypothetical protein H6G64_10865 [Calothrix sp. FACHB-156]|nr:hypothetical protein [Calothrix sp. FACHB-156]
MQRQLSSIALVLTTLTSTATLYTIPPAFSQAPSSESVLDKYTFFCQDVFDKASGEKIPTTVAWNPQKNKDKNVRLIVWKSEYFNQGGWTPKQRCEKVTEKFNLLYKKGSLEYFTHGIYKGYPVICGVAKQGEICNEDNILFTVKLGYLPEKVLERLTDSIVDVVSDPIYQKSGDRIYFFVTGLLNKAPIINEDK